MGAPGCDDAPLITVPRGDHSKQFTLIFPYYENPVFLERQMNWWRAMPTPMWQKVIIVDDGSPKYPAVDILKHHASQSWLRLFRIGVDIRWNWLAARNIGAHHSDDGWLLITDMDHVVRQDVVMNLMTGAHDPGVIYRFSRREHTGQVIHPHPNSWFYTRRMFWRIGGYDEACSGYYGTDGEYRRRCAKTAPIRIMTDQLERHEYQGDSSTTTYKRKQPEDAAVKQMIRARPKNWKPKVLSFPYTEVRL